MRSLAYASARTFLRRLDNRQSTFAEQTIGSAGIRSNLRLRISAISASRPTLFIASLLVATVGLPLLLRREGDKKAERSFREEREARAAGSKAALKAIDDEYQSMRTSLGGASAEEDALAADVATQVSVAYKRLVTVSHRRRDG